MVAVERRLTPIIGAMFAQIMELNESPIFLLLDTTVDPARKDLPVTLYETGEQAWTCASGLGIRVYNQVLAPVAR